MQPYQEEYLSNLSQIAELTKQKAPGDASFEEYAAQLLENEARVERLVSRSMELLRGRLFPILDDLYVADEETVEELEEFSLSLFNGSVERDVGLFCQIRQALLTLARRKRDRAAMIRHLYWLGLGRNSVCSKLVGLELSDIQKYTIEMRLCFTEAAAYLKYFDEIDDSDTRGYILRSRANIALGQFSAPGEKVRLLKRTLQILQDKEYQEKAPELPWDRFIYMTHQNMASSIPYSRETAMTPEDMADIMESAYIVFQHRIQEAEEQQKQPPVKPAFSYYAIEYCCGIDDLDRLLTKVEDLLDSADTEDYSPDSMYSMISLPAFYCQYLNQYPERIPPRTEYVESLYRRMMDYVDRFPGGPGDPRLFSYLRQVAYTYVETEHGIPYEEYLETLMLRFAPEVYVHSRIVGEASSVLCGLIVDEEPAFFDDIEEIAAVEGPAEKRSQVLAYAMRCGLFHDVGKINVIALFSGNGRQWFDREYDMARLHTLAGYALLSARASTSRYAVAALGHHAWYDGSRGYPDAYTRLECSSRQMVDVIGLVDWLENVTHTARLYTGVGKSFAEAVRTAAEQEGKQFSPLLTARLRDSQTVERLYQAFAAGRRSAYRRIYDDARRGDRQS